jgi:hypothetical protein
MRIHSALGPGLFEGLRFENSFVLDLLVDSRVVVEIKSVNFNETPDAWDQAGRDRLEEDPRRPPLLRVPRVK